MHVTVDHKGDGDACQHRQAADANNAKTLIRSFMPEPRNDVEELHSEGAESGDGEVNRDLFKDQHGRSIPFFLHKSIKKRFSRRNLTRDIKVPHEPLISPV